MGGKPFSISCDPSCSTVDLSRANTVEHRISSFLAIATKAPVRGVYPPDCFLHHRALLVVFGVDNAISTQGNCIDLPGLPVYPRNGIRAFSHGILGCLIFVRKDLLQQRAPHDSPAAVEQTSIASAMPKALAETHALLAAIHDLATYPTRCQIEYGVVAGFTGETNAPTQNARRPTS
ncbi:hypothetical protein AB5N19_06542 [Seiridium cardinale]|uniref:Uncharacterized protein n=1 Tax=Seiridium cardinale TaxID=138064 RepID=A0ABR2XZP9_9PEZI